MNKSLEKNRLDLAYRRQLHYLNAILLLATAGVLSFIGTFIWQKELFLQGIMLTIFIFLVVYFLHKKIDKNLELISCKIKDL